VIQVGGEWYFEEYGPSTSIRSLGLNANSSSGQPLLDGNGNPIQTSPEQERQGVIELLSN
jgi:hypothetical protein